MGAVKGSRVGPVGLAFGITAGALGYILLAPRGRGPSPGFDWGSSGNNSHDTSDTDDSDCDDSHSSTGGSSSQPPNNNQNNKNLPEHYQEQTETNAFFRALLNRLKKLSQFKKLEANGVKRIVYQKYIACIGKRFKIVMELQAKQWTVSSSCFEVEASEGDKSGDEWLNDEKLTNETHLKAFSNIFGEDTLDKIVIKAKSIFKGINSGQTNVLKKFIVDTRRDEYLDLEVIVNISRALLSQVKDEFLTFHNFVCLAKFGNAYVHEQLTQRNDAYNQSPSDYPGLSCDFKIRRMQLAEIIASEIADSSNAIIDFFRGLISEIFKLMNEIDPKFDSVISAFYHYFKHKFNYLEGKIFTPREYFEFVREQLEKLKKLQKFYRLKEEHMESKTERVKNIVYKKYYAKIGKWLKIVIKIQGKKWGLASFYFEDPKPDCEGEIQDGEEWLDDEKLPRE